MQEQRLGLSKPPGRGALAVRCWERWRGLLASWKDDQFRAAANELAADTDATGWRVASLLQLALLAVRTCLRERQPFLALLNASQAVIGQVYVALIARRRATYVRHREVLVTAGMANLCWVVLNGALNGGRSLLVLHGGSPLLLLALLLVTGPAMYLCLFGLYTRLVLSWSKLALPTLALASLAAGPALCGRMLEDPGVEVPLRGLHSRLSVLHAAVLSPDVLLPGYTVESSMQQCLAVNGWSMLVVGVALPLLLLSRWERCARQRFEASRRRLQGQQQRRAAKEQQGASSSGRRGGHDDSTSAGSRGDGPGNVVLPGLSEAEAAAAEAAAEPEAGLPEVAAGHRPPGWWLVEPYLASCAIWQLVSLAAAAASGFAMP